jgi:hypothetical protein
MSEGVSAPSWPRAEADPCAENVRNLPAEVAQFIDAEIDKELGTGQV